MPPITLEAVQAKQNELAAMIEQLTTQARQVTAIEIEGCTIELQPGEHYAGAVLDENSQHKHHLVLMAPRPESTLKWQAAMDWATSIGGTLPTRQEQALLYANCKPHLKPEWHWSSATHDDDASCAWYCYFSNGHQFIGLKSFEGSAVAVRRF
jgi:hypothetical protein